VRRREFIAGLGGAATLWPVAARAQQQKVPVVGLLSELTPEAEVNRVAAFETGLREIGYVAGTNVSIEYQWAHGQKERLPSLASDFVRRSVSVIATGGVPATAAAKAATSRIPIVFNVGFDPVFSGLVSSLNRPGGNLTGVARLEAETEAKRLELLHQLVPGAKAVGYLLNPTNPNDGTRIAHDAAHAMGVELILLPVSSASELKAALTNWPKLGAGALLIQGETLFTSQHREIAAQALQLAIPAVFTLREFAKVGGLASLGADRLDAYRLSGTYAGRILKGETAGNLPVQQATKVELTINLKTAKALGLTVPPTLLARAEEVIE
jgi:putative ABC transport system substrate-binding protein